MSQQCIKYESYAGNPFTGLTCCPKTMVKQPFKNACGTRWKLKSAGFEYKILLNIVGFSVPVIAFVRGVRCKLHPESVITPASWGLELLEAESCPAADHHRSGVQY
jgi:hypothetical protein